MNELEMIDDYFAGRLSPADRHRFETTLQHNPLLASTIAFYLLARQTAREEASRIVKPLPIRRSPVWVLRVAAASILLMMGLSWYHWIWQSPPSAGELAEQYLSEQYDQLPTTLGGTTDSLKTGISDYNQRRWKEAGAVFESILQREPAQPDALKFSGLVSLRLGKYDYAIDRFHRLGRQTDLYSNPGIFLEALACLKRGRPMDKNRAKNLLRTVIQGNLEGKEEAEVLVKRIK